MKKLVLFVTFVMLLAAAICPAVYAEAPAFVDLPPEGHWAHDPILWAYDEGITAGIDENHFGPHEQITRAQVVMMIWRYKGSLEPAENGETMPFLDVPVNQFYYKAVLNAWQMKWIGGTSSDRFDPNAVCTRAQLVAILGQAFVPVPNSVADEEDRPILKDVNDFVDVEKNSYYYTALRYFAADGVIAGTDETHFSPNEPCTRDQFVTILYRIYYTWIYG